MSNHIYSQITMKLFLFSKSLVLKRFDKKAPISSFVMKTEDKPLLLFTDLKTYILKCCVVLQKI